MKYVTAYVLKHLSPLDIHPIQAVRLMLLEKYFQLGEKWCKPDAQLQSFWFLLAFSMACSLPRFQTCSLLQTCSLPCTRQQRYSFAFHFAGYDGYLDSSRLSAYLSIQRTLHESDHVDIKMMCLLLTGSTRQDDVAHSHTDPSYRIRNKAYDKDSPDEVRTKAINRRQEFRS
jgi:hypothetical protein